MRELELRSNNNYFISKRVAKIFVDGVYCDNFNLSERSKRILIDNEAKTLKVKIHWWSSKEFDLTRVQDSNQLKVSVSSEIPNGLLLLIVFSFFVFLTLLFVGRLDGYQVYGTSSIVFLLPILIILYWQLIAYKRMILLSSLAD